MIAMSHPTGNANVRAVLAALDGARLLDVFFTTVGVRPNGIARAMPEKLRHTIERRAFSAEHAAIEFHPWKELQRLAGCETIDAVCFDLDAHAARKLSDKVGRGVLTARRRCASHQQRGEDTAPHQSSITSVYCYEDCARDTFRLAREREWMTFYDLPIAYWETSQRLLHEEAQRWPQWEPTLVGTRDSREKLDRKTEELALADVVLCPSQFVLDSLPDEARMNKTCVVAEFGSPRVDEFSKKRQRGAGGTLRVLFAGSLTQRKGLADLFAAMKLLKRSDIELVVMGAPIAPLDFYQRQLRTFRYEPPRSHAEVLALMRSCDVFALPSIVEGRALVQQEAMACGLPLVVTPNAGGEDLIDEGRTGFLVPIRSPEILAEKLAWFADHREALPEMSAAAQTKAREYTWQAYGEKVLRTVQAVLTPEEVAV